MIPKGHYPIQDGPSVPWAVMEPHESTAQKNHGQSLAELAERGGLGAAEAWLIVQGMDSGPFSGEQYERFRANWFAFAECVNNNYAALETLRTFETIVDRYGTVIVSKFNGCHGSAPYTVEADNVVGTGVTFRDAVRALRTNETKT